MTPAEREQLQRHVQRSMPALAGVFAGLAAFALAALLALLAASFLPNGANVAGPIALVAGAVAALIAFVRSRQATRRAQHVPYLQAELAAGLLEVARYTAEDAIAVEELEDEGLSYFLRLAGGQVLLLTGQYLYEPAEARRFPCREFAMVRTPRSRVLVDLQCRGRYLAPSSTRGPLTEEDIARIEPFEDGAVLDLPFESLRVSAA